MPSGHNPLDHIWRGVKDFSHRRAPAAYELLWRLRHGRSPAIANFEEIEMPEKYYKLHHIIRAITGGAELIVQSGPFAGMAYETRSAGSAYYPKLLGSYEAELHEALETILSKHYDDVINVGCGEGYYAVGLALRLPRARVHAFDLSPLARRLCANVAALNGVADRVSVAGECTHQHLRELTRRATLVVCDCEGCEVVLLQPDLVPGLRSCDLLVELHDFVQRGLTQILLSRFAATHEIKLVSSIERDPSAYTCLDALDFEDRLVAVAEGRPEIMQWALMTPRRGAT